MNSIKKFIWKDTIKVEYSRGGESFSLESLDEPREELKQAFAKLRSIFIRSRQEFDEDHIARYGINGISFAESKDGDECFKIHGYYIFPNSGEKTEPANSLVIHAAFNGFWDNDRNAYNYPFYATNKDLEAIEDLKDCIWDFVDGKRGQDNLPLSSPDTEHEEWDGVPFFDDEDE